MGLPLRRRASAVMKRELDDPYSRDQVSGERPEAPQKGHLTEPPCHNRIHEDCDGPQRGEDQADDADSTAGLAHDIAGQALPRPGTDGGPGWGRLTAMEVSQGHKHSRLGVRPKPTTIKDAAEHRMIRSCDAPLPHLESQRTFVPRGSARLPSNCHDRTELAARPDFAARPHFVAGPVSLCPRWAPADARPHTNR